MEKMNVYNMDATLDTEDKYFILIEVSFVYFCADLRIDFAFFVSGGCCKAFCVQCGFHSGLPFGILMIGDVFCFLNVALSHEMTDFGSESFRESVRLSATKISKINRIV